MPSPPQTWAADASGASQGGPGVVQPPVRAFGRLAANAASNALRGVSLLAVTVALPAVLVRVVTSSELDAWILISQLATYATFLDLGIQTAVSREVAAARSRGNHEEARRAVAAGTAMLGLLAILGAAGTAVLAWHLPHWFTVDPDLAPAARTALVALATAALVGLPASAWIGGVAGCQRSELTAAIVVTSNVTGAVAVSAAAWVGAPLGVMGACLAIPRLAGHIVHLVVMRSLVGRPVLRLAGLRAPIRRLASSSSTLAVWSAGMLMVAGLDATIVGRVDYAKLGAYGVAASVVALVNGLQTAALAALIPAMSSLHAQGRGDRLGAAVVEGTRLANAMLLVPSALIIAWAPELLRLWLGDGPVAVDAVPLLRVLVAANIVRLSMSVFSAALIGAGEHRRVVLSPLAEGLTNVAASVLLGRAFGAVGVAWGTAVGAVVGVALHVGYNLARTTSFRVHRTELARDGFARPVLGLLPLVGVAALARAARVDPLPVDLTIAALTGVFGALGMAALGITAQDRRRLRGVGDLAVGRLPFGRASGGRPSGGS